MDDPIFELSAPSERARKLKKIKVKDLKVPPTVCSVCSLNFSEQGKKPTLCDFCSKYGCPDCVYKQYPFPVQGVVEGSEDGTERATSGLICLTCETKLHINVVSISLFNLTSSHFGFDALQITSRLAL